MWSLWDTWSLKTRGVELRRHVELEGDVELRRHVELGGLERHGWLGEYAKLEGLEDLGDIALFIIESSKDM